MLVSDSRVKLYDLVLEFEWVFQGKGLQINLAESKVKNVYTKTKGDDSQSGLDV